MGIEVAISVLAALASVLISIASEAIRSWLQPDSDTRKLSYQEKVAQLSKSLMSSASEMDKTLKEMMNEVDEQKTIVIALEKEVNDLAERKKLLEDLTPEVAGHFYAMLEKNQQENESKARRQNWLFFALGLLASIPINILTNQL